MGFRRFSEVICFIWGIFSIWSESCGLKKSHVEGIFSQIYFGVTIRLSNQELATRLLFTYAYDFVQKFRGFILNASC